MKNTIKKQETLLKGCVILCVMLSFAIALLLSGCAAKDADGQEEYITDRGAFLNALLNEQREIYVGDIDFGEAAIIPLNNNIKIIGKKEKSVWKNAYFKMTGESVAGREPTSFGFENIVFDGGVDLSQADFSGEKSWTDIFGTHDQHCIDLYYGYCKLVLEGCEFTHYAAEYGSCIYRYPTPYDNPTGESEVIVRNCKFYENAAFDGTMFILGHYDYNVYVEDSNFTLTRARRAWYLILAILRR